MSATTTQTVINNAAARIDESSERISRFVTPFRVTLGTAVHCIACKERLTFHNSQYHHGTIIGGFHGCPASLSKKEKL